ncbi:kinesin-like protein KIFC3 isoform 2-T2 [Discoglossus pictus]
MYVLCSLLVLYFQSLLREQKKERLKEQVIRRQFDQRKKKVLPVTSCSARLIHYPMMLHPVLQAVSYSFPRWDLGTVSCTRESLRHRGYWWFAVGKVCSSPISQTMVGTLSQLQQDTQEEAKEEQNMQGIQDILLRRSVRIKLPKVGSLQELKILQGKRQTQAMHEQEDIKELQAKVQGLLDSKDRRQLPEDQNREKRMEFVQETRDLQEWRNAKSKRQLQENLQETSSLREKLDQKEREHGEVQRQAEEMSSLQIQPGDTDLEKHRDLLVSDNERLRQELQLLRSRVDCENNQELVTLQQRVCSLEKEEAERKILISNLQREVQQKAERLAEAELRLRDSARERVEEEERLNRRLREYQLSQQPQIKYVVQTVEVESGKMKAALSQAQSHSMSLQKQVDLQRQVLQEMQQQLQRQQKEAEELRAQVELYELELDQSQAQMVQEYQSLQEEKEQAVSEAFKRAQEEMRAVHLSLDGVRKNLLTLQPALRTLTHDYNALKRQVRDFPIMLNEAMTQAHQEFALAAQSVRETNAELLRKYRRELQLRKECHNQLIRLRGNIRVLARVRPVTQEDGVGPGAQSVVAFDTDDDGILHVTHKGKGLSFELDRVFTPRATQEEVFCEVAPLITSCLDGYSVCIMAYGQTGSGKTYSMEGTPSDPGINQRALSLLLSEVKERSTAWEHELSVSMTEIYNESLRDLLGSDPHTSLDIKMSPGNAGDLYVPGLTEKIVQSMQDINKILDLGRKQRATHHTNLNAHSSRSHALLTLTAKGRETCTGICTTGKLYLVDLAGSERVSRSGAAGERLREAQCINRSLSALGDVFSALRSQQGHVPYRNSKLTYLLQEALSRDGKAVLLLQVSPTENNVNESLCSLRFGDRVRTVELGVPARKIEQASPSTSNDRAESDSSSVRSSRNTSVRRKPPSSLRQRIGPP